jgi:PAS domain S-box-containing protein
VREYESIDGAPPRRALGHSLTAGERLQVALHHSQITTTLVSTTGAVIQTTHQHQQVLGYSKEFWATRTMFDVLEPDQHERAEQFRQDVLASPGQEMNIEVKVRAADGTLNDVMVQAINLIDEPSVNAIVLTSTNVTEERRVLAELSRRSETAEAVANAQTRLLATVSHELRNPLHVIQGIAELLASEDLPPRAAELAKTLANQINGLSAITNDLLETARLDSEAIALDLAPVDLPDLIAEIVEYAKASMGQKRLTIGSLWAPGVSTWVETDRARLRQVLRNLIGNAVKFTNHGSVRIEVSASPADVVDADDVVEISIVDTGVGIPLNEIGAILEPFQTGSTAGEQKGAGLGLAIVHRLVTALGGTLTITSTLRQGSSFIVALPLKTLAIPEVSAPKQFVDRRITAGACVLVVEDNLVNQQLAKSQLDRLGMTACIVGSGEEALEFLADDKKPRIDVVLMDYQLPGIDGLETARQIRLLDGRASQVPIVGLTASASVADRNAFLDAGLDGFIAKPATMIDLRYGISEVMNRSRVEARRVDLPEVIDLENCDDLSLTDSNDDSFDGRTLDQLVEEFADRKLVVGLVETFVADLRSRTETFLTAIESGDAIAAARVGHSLKSSSKLLGADELSEQCRLVESGKSVDTTSLRALIDSTTTRLGEWVAGQ